MKNFMKFLNDVIEHLLQTKIGRFDVSPPYRTLEVPFVFTFAFRLSRGAPRRPRVERVWFITENKLPYQLVGPPAGWSLEIERLSPSTRPLHKLRPPAELHRVVARFARRFE